MHPRTLGSPQAPLTVFDISDLQCRPCAAFAMSVFPLIEERYIRPGQVRWIFLNWPKTAKHKNALRAAEYAAAASMQGRFREMQLKLFETQAQWAQLENPTTQFETVASSLGLDVAEMTQVIVRGGAAREVAADLTHVERWKLSIVPSFVARDKVLFAGCPDELRQLGDRFDEALADTSTTKAKSLNVV